MLVLLGDVEDCEAARGVEPSRKSSEHLVGNAAMAVDILVAVRHEKIRPQHTQIKRDLPDPVGAVDNTQDPLFATDSSKPLEREPHTRQADNGIEHRAADRKPLLLAGPSEHLTKAALKFILRDRILKADLARLQRTMLCQGNNALLDGAVDRLEVDQGFAGLEVEVIQDRCDACRGVLDEDAFVLRDVEELRDGCARCV